MLTEKCNYVIQDRQENDFYVGKFFKEAFRKKDTKLLLEELIESGKIQRVHTKYKDFYKAIK